MNSIAGPMFPSRCLQQQTVDYGGKEDSDAISDILSGL